MAKTRNLISALKYKAQLSACEQERDALRRENENLKSARVELKLEMVEACRVVAELRRELAELREQVRTLLTDIRHSPESAWNAWLFKRDELLRSLSPAPEKE